MLRRRIHIKETWSRFWDKDPSKAEFNPYRDWKYILLAAFVGLVLAILSNVFIFFSVQSGDSGDDAPEISSLMLNRKDLEEALNSYREKSEHFDVLTSSREMEFQEVSDPSL